jgi:DEAD/DEAH box helicase domain-containing protein
MTSATIANPKILATNLIEESIVSIEEDGSPSGEKNFLIYNPPLINRELGIRESLLSTTTKIAERFLDANTQTLVFCQSRRFVEQMVKEIHTKTNHSKNLIRGYRSGYLKRERREIEEGLKNGSISMAVATNALELGVDIGGVDVVLLAGYPGSIASLRQRSGRAGRSTNNALSILITGMNPLDQYFARYPEYLTGRPLEQALIDANNPLILLSHIKCAAFELPFEENDKFGNLEWNELEEFLEYLCETGTLQKKKQKYFWLADGYPSSDFSIRSTAAGSILLQCKMNDQIETIGEVDYSSGLWMTHPGAIYLHDGESYYVNALDLEKSIALLSKSKEDYLTEPILSVDINVISQKDENDFENFTLHFGEIEVRSQVTGFNKVQFRTREILGEELLDLPVTKLQTFGCWIELTDNCVNKMKLENLWFSDPIDYGLEWKNTRNTILERDKWTCQSCGKKETAAPFHVHHKIPFKTFILLEQANNVSNLITLCPDCHAIAELNVRIRSGLSGLRYVMSNLAPMLVLCDSNDLGSFSEPKSKFSNFRPVVLLYDSIPGGVGLSEALFRRIKELFKKCLDLVKVCDCQDGCPSCVGPVSESGAGGKKEALYLLSLLLEESKQ